MREYARKWRTANPGQHRRRDPEKVKENRRRDYEKHREKRLAQSRRWAVANPGRTAAIRRRWYEANRSGALEQMKMWRREHPDAVAERQRRDRAHKLMTSVARITPALLTAKLAYWGGRCWLCGGEPRTWDHVKPQTKSGPHILANLRPACLSCNTRKHNRWPFPTSPASARQHPLVLRAQVPHR